MWAIHQGVWAMRGPTVLTWLLEIMTAVPSFLCSQAVPFLFTTTSDANGSAWSHQAIKLSHYFTQADKLAPSSEPLRLA